MGNTRSKTFYLNARPPIYAGLDSERSGQQPEWEGYRQKNYLKYTVHGYPNDSEWEKEEPNEWIGHQCEEGQWPAQDEKNAPEQESEHG